MKDRKHHDRSERFSILTVEIRDEQGVVLARQRARQIAQQLGFDTQEQTRISTAISEIVRNAFMYAGGGKAEFSIGKTAPQVLIMRVIDAGSGIADLEAVLNGTYRSTTGLGLGLIGAKRLMDEIEIDSQPGRGTVVVLSKFLPQSTPQISPQQIGQFVDRILYQSSQNPYTELQQQNQELLSTLEELRQRQEELAQLNQELGDTNRGVVALYAELNDRAESFQKASELKTRFLSDLSHEFRTPLNAILSLSNMLLSRFDGELSEEQERQVSFIQRSTESLTELVDDLLDLAKVEAGKVQVNVSTCRVEELFGVLRGMLRPLLSDQSSVKLIFEDAANLPALRTDEGKVSQILRNLVSNALKFTERGEVRISATLGTDQTITFTVADTGIGIALDDQQRIFEEFVQIDHPLQRQFKGTGLGLPLCRRLAELLGGQISVMSQFGMGSEFSIALPIQYSGSKPDAAQPQRELDLAQSSIKSAVKVLIIDDDAAFRYTIAHFLAQWSCCAIAAKDGYEGLYRAKVEQPDVIVLDLFMPGIDGFEVLAQLKADTMTCQIPVIIVTSKILTSEEVELLNSTQVVTILPKQIALQTETVPDLKSVLGVRFKMALIDAGIDLK